MVAVTRAASPAVPVATVLERVAEAGAEVSLEDARIVVVGVCMETDRAEPMLGILKELNVQYVLGYTPEEFAYSLRLIAEGQVDAASMVTASVGIDLWLAAIAQGASQVWVLASGDAHEHSGAHTGKRKPD